MKLNIAPIFSLKTQAIFSQSDIDDAFESIYSTIILNIQKSFEKGLGWILTQSQIMLLIFENINS